MLVNELYRKSIFNKENLLRTGEQFSMNFLKLASLLLFK